jgi:hypothetical protein
MLPMAAFATLLQALPTQQQALQLAFPGCMFTRKEFFLTDAQASQVKALAKADLPGLWFVGYEAWSDGKLLGVGFFDSHRVRSEQETALTAASAAWRSSPSGSPRTTHRARPGWTSSRASPSTTSSR